MSTFANNKVACGLYAKLNYALVAKLGFCSFDPRYDGRFASLD